jgi:hypothetical protein
VSTIKVDTYLTRGGASEIAIDKLKGASSAASMTVVGEGGTTTTNLQQGLCKWWVHLKGADTFAVVNSFNNTSGTDHGVGDYTLTMANDFSGATDKSIQLTPILDTGVTRAGNILNQQTASTAAQAAGTLRIHSGEGARADSNGGVYDSTVIYMTAHGDLA